MIFETTYYLLQSFKYSLFLSKYNIVFQWEPIGEWTQNILNHARLIELLNYYAY